MININLFGGPGVGKSTTASGLFYKLKSKDYVAEYVQEYAKELTFGKDFTKLSDQLLMLGEQHHRMFRLKGQVDYIIHDSPFVMGLVYLKNDIHLPKKEYEKLIVKMFKSYDNINIFLKRNNDAHNYQEYGRIETFQDAQAKDVEIMNMLKKNKIPFTIVETGKQSIKEIYKIIKGRK